MGFFEFIVDNFLMPDVKTSIKDSIKPVAKLQILERAAKKYFNSPREANDLYSFTVIAHYAMRQPNGVTYQELEEALIKSAYY